MIEHSFFEVARYDAHHGTDLLVQLRETCSAGARQGQALGVFSQLRTDWVSQGPAYALAQTLRYVGYGYVDESIFYNLGKVMGEIFELLDTEVKLH